MPRGDQTGPPRGGMAGSDGGAGRGRGIGRGGGGRGGMGSSRPGAGPGGECICPSCGARAIHQAGIPCFNMSCPKCGNKMTRG